MGGRAAPLSLNEGEGGGGLALFSGPVFIKVTMYGGEKQGLVDTAMVLVRVRLSKPGVIVIVAFTW